MTKWRARFLRNRLGGLSDEPRPGYRAPSPTRRWRRWWCAHWRRPPRGRSTGRPAEPSAPGGGDGRSPAAVRSAGLLQYRVVSADRYYDRGWDRPHVGSQRQAPTRDNAMVEAVNGTFTAGLIEMQGSWRDVDQVERAVFQWVTWHNAEWLPLRPRLRTARRVRTRLLEAAGSRPAARFKQDHRSSPKTGAAQRPQPGHLHHDPLMSTHCCPTAHPQRAGVAIACDPQNGADHHRVWG